MNNLRKSRLNDGFMMLREAKLAEAAALADLLLAESPKDPEVLFFASETKIAADDLQAALTLMSAAVEAAPAEPQLLLKLARLQTSQRRRLDARATLVRATKLLERIPPETAARLLWMIGGAYARLDDPTEAAKLYQRALAAKFDDPALRYDLAVAQFFSGDFDNAERSIAAMLERQPKAGNALYLRATLRRRTKEWNNIGDLRARLSGPFPDSSSHAATLYALAKELEDLGEHEASFAALTEGAALKRRSLQYDAAGELASISAITTTYSARAMQVATVGHEEAGAIFIVGMPRTGTTLVERMLTRHSEVRSAGELLDFGQVLASATREVALAHPHLNLAEASSKVDFAMLGRDYMRGARESAGECRMFVDKMPINFIYCGLIKKALPNARIIHLVRAPMDSCYAVYKTLFGQAYHFSYDQNELAAYFANYLRTMAHWHAVMPGNILDVHYESLVADVEAEARRILSWCALDWQPAVLSPSENTRPSTTASAAQVRAPVHTESVGRWRKYESGLHSLRARLAAEGVNFSE